jgi:hypothetical protein
LVKTLEYCCSQVEKFYQHTAKTPIHGTGQGSCASPAIWLLISCILMDIYKEKAHGMNIYDVIKESPTICQYIEAFVDDASSFTNTEFENKCIKLLLKYMKEDGYLWTKLLEASGGKLELSKCFYYLLTWQWDRKGNAIPSDKSEQKKLQNAIYMHSTQQQETSLNNELDIKQKDINISHKTLGATKNITGNEQDQFIYLLEKSNKIGVRASNAQFNRRQATKTYYSCYIPAMKYSLAASNLTEQQCNKIQSKATNIFLNLMGYKRHFHRTLVYAPLNLGGIGMCQLYISQICLKIELILCHINANITLGQMIVRNLNWLQMNAGISENVLNARLNINYIKPTWFHSLQEFLITIGGIIQIKLLWKPELSRKNDLNIMEGALKLNMTRDQLQIFNNWRIFYQVINLSAITTMDGTKIRNEFLTKKECNNYKPISQIRWPNQEMPHKSTFPIWRRTIERISQCKQNGVINSTLGEWIKNPKQAINIKTGISEDHKYLLVRQQEGKWKKIRMKNISRGKNYYSKIGDEEDNDYTVIPVDIYETKEYYYINLRNMKEIPTRIKNNTVKQELVRRSLEQHINRLRSGIT